VTSELSGWLRIPEVTVEAIMTKVAMVTEVAWGFLTCHLRCRSSCKVAVIAVQFEPKLVCVDTFS
jgi:hypothetical protein